jgi:hypothetical protein
MKQLLPQSLALLPLALLAGCGGGTFNSNNPAIASGAPAPAPTVGSSPSGSGPSPGSGTGSSTGSTTGSTGGAPPAGSGASTSGIPASAKTIADIQNMPDWESCTNCANGAFAAYSMSGQIATPALSGSSAKFSLEGGTAPFGVALWWKYLTTDNTATHFVYDLYFYVENPSAAQALEFNVDQSVGGLRYDFATQCDLDSYSDHTWRLWNPESKGWTSSSAYCPQPAAKAWNHLVWEFERSASNQVVFKAVTLNDKRSEVNLTMPAQADSSNGIDVAFQLDANRDAALYSVWLDKVKLIYW